VTHEVVPIQRIRYQDMLIYLNICRRKHIIWFNYDTSLFLSCAMYTLTLPEYVADVSSAECDVNFLVVVVSELVVTVVVSGSAVQTTKYHWMLLCID